MKIFEIYTFSQKVVEWTKFSSDTKIVRKKFMSDMICINKFKVDVKKVNVSYGVKKVYVSYGVKKVRSSYLIHHTFSHVYLQYTHLTYLQKFFITIYFREVNQLMFLRGTLFDY